MSAIISILNGDLELAGVIEKASADDDASYVTAMKLKFPEQRFDILEFEGGSSLFVGQSPYTNTHGFGISKALHTQVLLEKIETFYKSHSVSPTLSVGSVVESDIWKLLGDYNIITTRNEYAYVSTQTMITSNELDIRQVNDASQLRLWLRVVAEGFASKELKEPDAISLGQSIKKGNIFFLGYLNGEAVSASCLYVQDKFARLSGMATLRKYRGLGFQSGMIQYRTQRAIELGCNIITSDTQPGNNSQRNLERAGFKLLYFRNILRKASGRQPSLK